MLDQVESPTTAGSANARPRRAGRRSDDPEAFDLADAFRFLRRNLGTIASAIIAAMLATAVYLTLTKPVYRADAQVLIDANLPQTLGEFRGLLDNAQLESQIAILQSDQVARTVVERANLLASSNAADASGASGPQSEAEAVALREAMQAAVRGGLQARRVGRSYVIEVSYHSADPETAIRIADAAVEAYIHDQFTARADAARQGSQWLEGRIEELRVQMNAAALKVQEFKAKRDYRIISKPENGQPADQQTTRVAQNTLEELESTAQTYRKIYENYLQAHTESVQRQSLPVTNARVLTRATAFKSHPRVSRLLAMAFAAGALVGLGIALLREMYLSLPLRPKGMD